MEAYTAHHADSLDEILHWPWKRFEKLYEKFTIRVDIAKAETRKDAIISALYANSTYTESKEGQDARRSLIDDYEEQYKEAVRIRLHGPDEEEIDPNNPFWQAMEKGTAKIADPGKDATVGEVVDYGDHDQG